MNEELNQVQDNAFEEALADEESLFDDEVEETPTEAETEEAKEVEEKPTEVAPQEPFITIRYNKEDKGLTKEEAIELSQKGMNYDHIYEKYNSLNGELERLARMNGLDVAGYLKGLNETQMKFEVSQEVEKLEQLYPNSSSELIEELANKNVQERYNNQLKEIEQEKNNIVDAQEQEILKQIDSFNKIYPKLEADKLDKGVYEKMKDGFTLLEAYTIWKGEQEARESNEAKIQAEIDKKNEENKKKSLGNTVSLKMDEVDDFLGGFLNN